MKKGLYCKQKVCYICLRTIIAESLLYITYKQCKQKVCYICKKRFSNNDNNKKYYKVRDHCYDIEEYRGVAPDICNLRYKTPKEIPVVFYNGSTYNYHFIIKELAEEFEGQFECLGENTEPIKKELHNGK